MNKQKLDQNEMKDIAHFLTRRSISSGKGEYLKSLKEYLETYNILMEELDHYNKSIN